MQFIDIFRQQFREASGEGALLELNMRLLADKVPELDAYGTLERVEEQIAVIFANHLTADDRETLRLCRQLRNKILHCDFHAVRAKLYDLGSPERQGGVRRMRLAPEGNALEAVLYGLEDPGKLTAVAEMTSTKAGSIFWVAA
jgi:hypothetical protein